MSLLAHQFSYSLPIALYAGTVMAASGSLDDAGTSDSSNNNENDDSSDASDQSSDNDQSDDNESNSNDQEVEQQEAQPEQNQANTNTNTNTNRNTNTQTTQWWTPTTVTTNTATTNTANTHTDTDTDTDTDTNTNTNRVTYNQYGFTGDQSRWQASTEAVSESESKSTHSVKHNKTSSAAIHKPLFAAEKDYGTKKAIFVSALLGLTALFTVM